MSEPPPINLGQTPSKPDPGFGAPGPPPKNNNKLIIGIIVGVVALIFVGCCGCCVVSSILAPARTEQNGEAEVSAESTPRSSSRRGSQFKGITEAGYNMINDDMSESEVEAILGKGNEVGSAGNVKTMTYEKELKIISINYQNGRVAGKVKTF
jgi:hypothetical protein